MSCILQEFTTELTSKMIKDVLESDPDLSLLYVYAMACGKSSLHGIKDVYDIYMFLIHDIEEHRVHRGNPATVKLRCNNKKHGGHRYYMDGDIFYVSASYIKSLFDNSPHFCHNANEILSMLYASKISGEPIILSAATQSFKLSYTDGTDSGNRRYKYYKFNGNRIAKDILCLY